MMRFGLLHALFAAMARRFVPERAEGFSGTIQYDLRTATGRTRHWTIAIDGARATAVTGAAVDPALTLKLSTADFLRIAFRRLDPAEALLKGRLDLAGDFLLAMRLGEMFGRPAPR